MKGYSLLAVIVIAAPATAWGQDADAHASVYDRYPWLPRLLGAQFTFIGQDMPPFPARYSGANSLTPRGDREATHTYGLYTGARLTPYLQIYFDGEMARGAGIGHTLGLAGLTDGDVIRQGSANLGQGPYLARSYARYLIPLGPGRDTAERGQDQLPVAEPTTRVEIKAGKWALSDDFDQNRYANSTRYQFMDWGLWNNLTWDFAANTRGYTNGLLLGYVSPGWTFKFAAAQMPIRANANTLDDELARAYALNAEVTVRPNAAGTVIRLLAYYTRARLGIYRDAIDIARARDTIPNIAADDARGRVKYGFGLNAEQPLADSGNTGVFLRVGWSDGKTEDFAFSEADRTVSSGLQLAGNSWHRATDQLGIGVLISGLSKDHEDYLAAGGSGFLIGDGRLRYTTENIAEVYYRLQIPHAAFIQVSPVFQFIDHPAYNTDRGPVEVYSLRVNLHY